MDAINLLPPLRCSIFQLYHRLPTRKEGIAPRWWAAARPDCSDRGAVVLLLRPAVLRSCSCEERLLPLPRPSPAEARRPGVAAGSNRRSLPGRRRRGEAAVLVLLLPLGRTVPLLPGTSSRSRPSSRGKSRPSPSGGSRLPPSVGPCSTYSSSNSNSNIIRACYRPPGSVGSPRPGCF